MENKHKWIAIWKVRKCLAYNQCRCNGTLCNLKCPYCRTDDERKAFLEDM